MKEKNILRISAVVAGLSGFIILFSTIYPIASYETQANRLYPTLLSPISGKQGDVLSSSYPVDYTKASNWFVGEGAATFFEGSQVTYYTMSIPKLKIQDAVVALGSDDLSKNLIHYPGTAAPGKIGSAVVFGHSSLPQFYNPKDYLSIFSTLPTLEKGDTINVEYDGISYVYIVEKKFEVLPTELSILNQPTDDSYLLLITCVPPGHPLKPRRLVVQARIVPPN